MNPTDPNDLLLEGWAESSGCDLEVARRELEALTDWLSDRGADLHVTYRVSLPSSVPAGDPRTAAKSIDDLNDRQWAVWWLLGYVGPMTDEETAARYTALAARHPAADGWRVDGHGGPCRILPPQTPQSIRTRRSELVRAGHVEPVLGPDGKQERRPTKAGGTAGVWRVASDALGVRSAA